MSDFIAQMPRIRKKTRWQKLRQKMRKQSESHLKTDYIVLYFRRCFCGYWCCFCCCVIHFAGFDHLWRLMNAIIANALNEIEIKIITHAILRLKKSKSVMKVDALKNWCENEYRLKREKKKNLSKMEHDFIIFIDAHALVIKNNHLLNISWCWDEIVFGRMKKKTTVSMGLDQNKFNLEVFFCSMRNIEVHLERQPKKTPFTQNNK